MNEIPPAPQTDANDGFVALTEGLYVFEAKRICDRLKRANVRFAIARTTFGDEAVVDPRKNNWAAALTHIENGFQRSGLGVLMRIDVHPDDLEAARQAMAPDGKAKAVRHHGFWTRTKISIGLLVALVVAAAFLRSCSKW